MLIDNVYVRFIVRIQRNYSYTCWPRPFSPWWLRTGYIMVDQTIWCSNHRCNRGL